MFTRETLESTSTAHARFFTPAMGDREDPATGSAAGPLAAYLHARDVIRGNKEIVVEQGDEVGRPGRIHVRLEEGEVLVGGALVCYYRRKDLRSLMPLLVRVFWRFAMLRMYLNG